MFVPQLNDHLSYRQVLVEIAIGCLTGAEILPESPFTVAGAGHRNTGLSKKADTPALAETSTSTGALKPPLDGVTLARPLLSVDPSFCVTFKITGMAGLPEFVSPASVPGAYPPGCNTVVRKVAGAASTGCGETAGSGSGVPRASDSRPGSPYGSVRAVLRSLAYYIGRRYTLARRRSTSRGARRLVGWRSDTCQILDAS